MSERGDCQQLAHLLTALPDHDLSPSEAARVQAHLAVCPSCREEARAFFRLGELLRQAPVPEAHLPTGAQAAAWIWEADRGRQTIAGSRRTTNGSTGRINCPSTPRSELPTAHPPSAGTRRLPSLKLALVALGMVICLVAWRAVRPPAASWKVVRLTGAPRVGSERISAIGRLKVGQWLETDSASRARIELVDIGQVKIEPNTRLRLVESRPNEHRLALARGALHARVLAPPRLFFVDTPSAEAVDLGCAYSLSVDPASRGLL